jgi:hypothetical protein
MIVLVGKKIKEGVFQFSAIAERGAVKNFATTKEAIKAYSAWAKKHDDLKGNIVPLFVDDFIEFDSIK